MFSRLLRQQHSKFEAGKEPQVGVISVTSKNISTVLRTNVPIFLYFHLPTHPDVSEYTERLKHQADIANRRRRGAEMAKAYEEEGDDAGLAIKVGLVDCSTEGALTHRFNIDPHMFPIIYFVRKNVYVDKLVGVVSEAQVKEAMEAFIEYAVEETRNEREGTTVLQKMKRADNDDENPMTLLNLAHTKLKHKELAKAKDLFQKAYEQSVTETQVVKKNLRLAEKKMTREVWEKLKREGCFNASPQALCGLAMCALASNERDKALKLTGQIREEFPFATTDLRDVAEAVVRVELLSIAEMNVEKDNYVSLMTYENLTSDPVEFYRRKLKLAVAHFIEKRHHQGIEECLRLVRAERKLLPALKAAGVVNSDLQLGPNAKTPAVRVLLGIFEALGSTHEHTMEGRKMLQALR